MILFFAQCLSVFEWARKLGNCRGMHAERENAKAFVIKIRLDSAEVCLGTARHHLIESCWSDNKRVLAIKLLEMEF